jgi:hypothetical protein
MYPGSYVLQKRTLSGSITQFITSENSSTLSDTSTNSVINISVYDLTYSSSNPLLKFDLPSTVFTRRINFEELINRVYDFRLNYNSTTDAVEPIYKAGGASIVLPNRPSPPPQPLANRMNFSSSFNSGLIALI